MPTTFKHARILAVPIAGFALAVAGLTTAPAQAVPGISVTVHIQDATTGVGVSDLNVGAYTDTAWVTFSAVAGQDGDYTATSDDTAELVAGDWTVDAYDPDADDLRYVESRTDITVAAGDNSDYDAIQAQHGAVVKGKITAPSGRVLKNFEVAPVSGGSPYWGGLGYTDSNGNFSLAGLEAGTYTFGYVSSYYTGKFTAFAALAQTLTLGEISATSLNLTKVKAPAGLSVDGKSSSKKKATLKIKVDNRGFGINSPGGTVKVKEGSKTRKSKVKIKAKGADSTISLTGLKKGKHTFTVYYTGGQDVNKESTKIVIKVK